MVFKFEGAIKNYSSTIYSSEFNGSVVCVPTCASVYVYVFGQFGQLDEIKRHKPSGAPFHESV